MVLLDVRLQRNMEVDLGSVPLIQLPCRLFYQYTYMSIYDSSNLTWLKEGITAQPNGRGISLN